MYALNSAYRTVAEICRRGVTWMSDLYVCKTREVWGHATPGNF